MAKKVVDNVLKMEWDESKALYTKGGKFGRTFVFAAVDYETEIGTVTVFFNCYTAFIWADNAGSEDEDRYNAKELKPWVKDNLDEAFPINYSNYIPIVEYGAEDAVAENVEKYGLGEYVDDILARLQDLKPYSEEKISDF